MDKNYTKKNAMKLIGRYFLAFLISLPFFILINKALFGKVNRAVIILLYVLIAGAIFLLGEFIRKKIIENKKKKYEEFLNKGENLDGNKQEDK